jgi:hypothetical protein
MMVGGGVDVSYDDPISCAVATAGGVPVKRSSAAHRGWVFDRGRAWGQECGGREQARRRLG